MRNWHKYLTNEHSHLSVPSELLARHDGRPDIWLNDCERSRHIEINYDEASIAFLGPKGGLKSAKAWFSRYGTSVVDALIALDSTNPKRRF